MPYTASTSTHHFSSKSQRPILHSQPRDSSSDSRTTTSSMDTHYSSSRPDRASGAFEKIPREIKHRCPDSGKLLTSAYHLQPADYYTAIVGFEANSRFSRAKNGQIVQVVNHNASATRPDEPRASNATYEDYKRTEYLASREYREHRSHKHRSGK